MINSRKSRFSDGLGGVNEIALALLQAALVVVCCIVVIKIIKRNSFLSLLFFGK